MIVIVTDTRRYDSPTRAEAASRTRRAVVEAAAELFETNGFAGTTMRSIAERAQVSVETVNALGPKHDLLRAAFERRFLGGSIPGEGSAPPLDATDASSVRAVLRPLIQQFNRSVGMHRTLVAAADADGNARNLVNELRATQRRQIFDLLDAHTGARRAERRRAADALSFVLSHHAYDHFVVGCRWTEVQYEDWAARAVLEEMQRLNP